LSQDQPTIDDKNERTRRSFLRLAASIVVGASVLLISSGMLDKASFNTGLEDLTGSSVGTNGRASLITVKVYYSMMAQYTQLDEEDFVLQTPCTIQDLINTVLVRHRTMEQMIQAMLTLLNGVPALPDVVLKDGDVVQFIPLSAGG